MSISAVERLRAKKPTDNKIFISYSIRIGDAIRYALAEQNMSQKQFAEMLGKSESEISRWLGGFHNFTFRTIAKIEDVLKVKLLLINEKYDTLKRQEIVQAGKVKTGRKAQNKELGDAAKKVKQKADV